MKGRCTRSTRTDVLEDSRNIPHFCLFPLTALPSSTAGPKDPAVSPPGAFVRLHSGPGNEANMMCNRRPLNRIALANKLKAS